MDIVKQKEAILERALSTLNKSLTIYKDYHGTDVEEVARDSSIQRFEYCVELFWKFLKAFLQEKEQVKLEGLSPRKILESALNAKLLNKKEFGIMIQALKDRNLTSHMYNEELADKLIEVIPLYYKTIASIAQQID